MSSNEQVKETADALEKCYAEFMTVLRNRHYVAGVKTSSVGDDCYSLIITIENRMLVLREALKDALTKKD